MRFSELPHGALMLLVDVVAMLITERVGFTPRRTPIILVTVVVGAVLLGACGDDSAATTQDDTGTETTETSMAAGMDHGGSASPAAPGARHIEVEARSFEFDPAEITVSAGEDIAIVLMSEDAEHDFTIDEFDGHVPAEAGETGYGGFTASEPGRYTYYCSVEGHREAGMEGVLVVEE